MKAALAKEEMKKEVFLEANREIDLIEVKDLNLNSILSMVERRAKRDSEVLSVVCDDQSAQ